MATVLTQPIATDTVPPSNASPITADEFARMAGTAAQSELVKGEVVETMPPGHEHGVIAALIVFLLQLWSRQGHGGYVAVETGFVLSRDPDTVRAPDVSYMRAERVETGPAKGFGASSPDLVVEIISPSETAEEVHAKVRDYLAAGALLVWTVYPTTREVIVHTPDGLARTYGPEATLEFPEALPGFHCTVTEIFATLTEAGAPSGSIDA